MKEPINFEKINNLRFNGLNDSLGIYNIYSIEQVDPPVTLKTGETLRIIWVSPVTIIANALRIAIRWPNDERRFATATTTIFKNGKGMHRGKAREYTIHLSHIVTEDDFIEFIKSTLTDSEVELNKI